MQNENHSSEAPGETSDSLRAVDCNPLLDDLDVVIGNRRRKLHEIAAFAESLEKNERRKITGLVRRALYLYDRVGTRGMNVTYDRQEAGALCWILEFWHRVKISTSNPTGQTAPHEAARKD